MHVTAVDYKFIDLDHSCLATSNADFSVTEQVKRGVQYLYIAGEPWANLVRQVRKNSSSLKLLSTRTKDIFSVECIIKLTIRKIKKIKV